MDIKHIHEMLETLASCAKTEVENGIKEVDTHEMGEVVDMIKDLAEAEYYATITKAMNESEYGVDYDETGRIDEKRYYNRNRYADGRYAPKGRGRVFYDGDPKYPMTVEDYKMYSPEYYRDMDRKHGIMYYTDTHKDDSRMRYMDSKHTTDKGEKMRNLEHYIGDVSDDLAEMMEGASPEEKSMLKSKLQVMMQKM